MLASKSDFQPFFFLKDTFFFLDHDHPEACLERTKSNLSTLLSTAQYIPPIRNHNTAYHACPS